jgi:D-alanyl-lipoteichoic acid acyltransferase DltB (MBOAT superfamily)
VVGYTIDVYRGQLEPERHLGIFALFVAFFPQLVAGPIERAGQMLPQFYRRFAFDPVRISGGLRLILWGLFQKVVIADRLGLYVDAVYNNPTDYRGWPVLLATFFFAFQIYCDFAGYTDIAIGLAKVLGFELMTNFQQPYFATSPADFWRRWHISLSTWFRDYLYIPLGGNRVPVARHYFNLFVVFLLSGLWHGASWTFVIWGGLHGLYIILEQAGRGLWPKLTAHLRPTTFPALPTILGSLLTFLLICLTWLFFRANTVADAFLLLSRLFPLTHFDAVNTPWEAVAANPAVQMPLALGLILLLLAVQALQRWEGPYPLLRVQPTWLRWGAYIVLALAVLNLGVTEAAPFIYFQF